MVYALIDRTKIYRFKVNIMTVTSSEIVSPNYPNPVSETNLDCVWTVKAQYGDGIVMRVLDVDMGAMCYANKLQVRFCLLSISLEIW